MFVADLHNDLVQRIMIGEDLTKFTNHGHSDLPRLKTSSIDLEILIIWVSNKSPDFNHFEKADKMYDKIVALTSVKDVVIPKNLSEILDAYNKKN